MPALVCARCKQALGGSYITAMNRSWHPQCFTCARCGKSLSDVVFIEKDDQPYCQADFLALFGIKCSVCGNYIDGTYVKNFWNDTYCTRHAGELPACFNCGRPVSALLTRGGVDFGDGRVCCNICKPKIIGEQEVNQRVLPRLVEFFKYYELPLTDLISGVPVHLVNAREISQQIKGDSLHPVTGLIRKIIVTQDIIRNGVVVGQQQAKKIKEILALNGLTEINVTGVIAHEIGHAYMFAHDFPDMPPVVEEGMAELFAFLWLKSRKGPEVAYQLYKLENNDSEIYGAGYKRAREYMGDKGFWALLNYVKKNAKFPI
nr:protein DA1 [Candidatus Sigynarchaeota archaeon]